MRAERREIRHALAGLTPEQWQQPSLCSQWTIRDLLAHLVAWDEVLLYRTRRQHLGVLTRFARDYVTSFASMRLLNRRLQRRTRGLDPRALLQRFAADDGDDLKWLFDGTNPAAHLAEYVIHRQDLCRPLGLPAPVPAERVSMALDGALQLPGVRLSAWRRLRRTRIEASDIGWARGHGTTRQMTGLNTLLWIAGRPSET